MMPTSMLSKALAPSLLLALLLVACAKSNAPATADAIDAAPAPATIYPFAVTRLDGSPATLAMWSGKVLLIVNTASECGFTPQYKGLEALQTKYEARGFSILGFPANDFGDQEPGSPEDIAAFCRDRYGVTFPMFSKVKTVGEGRSPLYAFLSTAKGDPKWNFHKYLISKKGIPVHAWPSATVPESQEIADAIERELAAK